jgi:hypothetical protein
MNKLIAAVLVGLPLLAATSLAQADGRPNGWGHSGVQASVTIGVPIGNHGYAVVGTGPAYYPGPVYYPAPAYYPAPVYYSTPYYYAPPPAYYGPVHGPGWKHGKKHHRHHDDRRGYYYGGNGHGH